MKFKLLILALILFASCSKEQTSDENVLNSDSKEISLDDFKDVQEQSDDKRGRGNCLDNCFFPPDFNFSHTFNSIEGEVVFQWSYGGSIALNPDVCNTTAYIQFKTYNGVCNATTTFPFSENHYMDITDEFLGASPGQITVHAPVMGAVIDDFELPSKIYEYRLIINAQCGMLSCCQDTDWVCF